MKAKKVQKKKKYKRVESGFSKYRNEIVGLIMFSFGVLALLSFIFTKSMGAFGRSITKLLLGMLGITAYLVPLVLVVYGAAMIFRRNSKRFNLKVTYFSILLVIISAFLETASFNSDDLSGRSVFGSIGKFFTDGSQMDGGGVLGGMLSVPFLMTFQVLGTVIILSTIAIIDIILLTNFSIAELLRNISTLFTNRLSIARENRRARLNEVKAEKQIATDEELEQLIQDEDEIKKPKVINFKIERENRKNKEVKEVKEAKEVDSLKPNIETNEQPQEQQQDEFSVRLTGFDDLADELVVSDMKNVVDPEKVIENTAPKPINEHKHKNHIEDKIDIPDIDLSVKANADKPKVEYNFPPVDLLEQIQDDALNVKALRNSALEDAKKLEDTLKSFGVEARVINISRGPAVTRYELQPSPGVKVSKIVNLSDDIALNLAAAGVRIEAPIPGKAAVGIEVPNKEMSPVFLREILESKEFKNHPSKLSFSVGKDISGETVVADVAKMPHLLIAGATGSGKSVCINTLIMSILFKASPDEVKLLMVDPKVVELGIYNGIPHLLIPVVTEPKKAAGALNWAVQEMVNRYKLFAEKGVRDLKGYNAMLASNGEGGALPQVVIIVDELADLMMVAPNDVEDAICRLAQMARAAGMHLVIATQRPSVDVITGVIKANIPSRISFAVSSQVDSRTILDMSGAEKLLGRGDMLFYPVGEPKPIRVKGAFVSDTEVEHVVEYIKTQGYSEYDENIIEKINNEDTTTDANSGDNDELLNQAIDMVVEAGQASVSLVQRKFKVGYSRAARIIDQMEARNIVGRFEGSKPRQVLITRQQWMEMQMTDKNK